MLSRITRATWSQRGLHPQIVEVRAYKGCEPPTSYRMFLRSSRARSPQKIYKMSPTQEGLKRSRKVVVEASARAVGSPRQGQLPETCAECKVLS